jgi:hypothetical protein
MSSRENAQVTLLISQLIIQTLLKEDIETVKLENLQMF